MPHLNTASNGPRAAAGWCGCLWKLLVLVLLSSLMPGPAWAWRDASGQTLDPRLVQRIKNGVTTKHEILAFFGQPKEVERTPDGLVYKYVSHKDAPAMPYKHEDRQIQEQSTSHYLIDDDKNIKRKTIKTEGKIVRSTLTVRFKPDGLTVLTHEYKEY